MSDKRPSKLAALKTRATVFAALGDETRLAVLAKLLSGEPQSIARLTEGTHLTRQAVTKHLRVLESAGVVRSRRAPAAKRCSSCSRAPSRTRAPISIASPSSGTTLWRASKPSSKTRCVP